MKMQKDVSIIIVNYKTSLQVKDCVESILNHTHGVEYEVIIVDNNSEPRYTEVIGEVIPRHLAHLFVFLPLKENLGFGGGNNKGLEVATGRNILFLNPDTVLINNAIKILSDFLDTHPQAGACGGNLYDEKGSPAFSFRRILPGMLWEFNELLNTLPLHLIHGKNYFHNYTSEPMEVGFSSGADLMVKRNVLEHTGGFHKDFFMYFEETDLCARIKKAGWKIYNVPDARIKHLEGASFGEGHSYMSPLKIRYQEESRKKYYLLHHSKASRYVSNILYQLYLTSRVIMVKDKYKRNFYNQKLKYFKG